MFPLGDIKVYVYGETPPATETVIEPSVLEHVEPWLDIVTESIPSGVSNVVPTTILQKAESVTEIE